MRLKCGVAQAAFFGGVADEGSFYQHAGYIGRFEYGKARLLHARFVQAVDFADFGQQGAAELQAVAHLGGGAHVEQGALHGGIAAVDVDAAYQVGLVFFGGKPACGGAAGAVLAQGIDAGAVGLRGDEGIGMDADKQVGLHAPRFLHAGLQGHEVVAIAREVGTHGAACGAAGVDAVAQEAGNAQHDVFFARAAGADGAWVFAAVAWVERDDDEFVALGCSGAYACSCGCFGGFGCCG